MFLLVLSILEQLTTTVLKNGPSQQAYSRNESTNYAGFRYSDFRPAREAAGATAVWSLPFASAPISRMNEAVACPVVRTDGHSNRYASEQDPSR